MGFLGQEEDGLAQLYGQNTFDDTVLEFDFTPTMEVVSFEYLFASEEYCQCVDQYLMTSLFFS